MATTRKTPVKKSIKDEVLDVEELLAPEPEPTPEQKRIAELEALLRAAEERERTNPYRNGRPVPEAALTPDQKRIRDLEDRLAQKNVEREPELVEAEDGIHFHVLKDGFNAFGQIWYRGQELLVDPHGEAAALTRNRLGESWLDFIDDPSAQVDAWGDQYLRRGPFKGRKGEKFDDEIARLDKRRGLAVPVSRED